MKPTLRSVTLENLRARTDRDLAVLAGREIKRAFVATGSMAGLRAAEALYVRTQQWVRLIGCEREREPLERELSKLRFILSQAPQTASEVVFRSALTGAVTARTACCASSQAAS